MKTKLLLLIGTLLMIQLAAGSVLADPLAYTIFNVGRIDPGDYGSQGRDISTVSGFVTGRNLGDNNQAILWTEGTGLVALPNHPSRAYCEGNAVNYLGTVVGNGTTTVYGSSSIPLIWEDGVVSALPLPADQSIGRAAAINNFGLAVGSVNGGGFQRAAMFQNGVGTVVTQTTIDGCYGTSLYGVNDSGIAAGPGADPNDAARNVGFVYDTVNDTAFEVGALPGDNGALIFGMSNAGHIVGSSMLFQGDGTPFIWTEDTGMQAIPFPTGTDSGSAKGVNSDGWVVGVASNQYSVPFLYDGDATYAVSDLVPEGTLWDLATTTSASAMAISEEGVFVGTGVYDGSPSAYVMVPDNVVPVLLQAFSATGNNEGIEINWQVSFMIPASDFTLDRSTSMNGPWAEVTAPVSGQGPNASVLDITAEPGQTYYYRLSTQSSDGQNLTLDTVSGQRIAIAGVILRSPMPNPAPGNTSLAFSIPVQQNVQLTVHDVRGRMVRTIVDGNIGTGEHVAQWDGRDSRGSRSPAGVYFISLKTQNDHRTQRVVLTR